MPTFEFIVEGPPVSLNAKNHNPKRYQRWIRKVREAARIRWSADRLPVSVPVEVAIANYYTADPPDVDNVIKPLLDALKSVVYVDDRQVHRVISERLDPSTRTRISTPNPLLAGAFQRYDELLHIVVNWK